MDRFVGGTIKGEHRPIQIMVVGQSKELDTLVEVTVEDLARIGEIITIPSGPASQGETR